MEDSYENLINYLSELYNDSIEYYKGDTSEKVFIVNRSQYKLLQTKYLFGWGILINEDILLPKIELLKEYRSKKINEIFS